MQSGVQINVSYITGLCPDADIDRKILRSGICVDCEFLHPVHILCSDIEIDLTISLPVARCLLRTSILHLGVGAQMLISIVNVFFSFKGPTLRGQIYAQMLILIVVPYIQGFKSTCIT